MGFRSATTTVEVYLDDFDDDDLIDYLEDRGYTVIGDDETAPVKPERPEVWKLYQSWLLDDKTVFEKTLREFFEKEMNKVKV
jgi:hypothetical protein